MSRLAYQGDDYPEASKKHLDDATVLERGGRHDGSAYLAGYVVECALKSLLLHEACWDERAREHDRRKLEREQARLRDEVGHGIRDLFEEVTRVCAAATSRSSAYIPNLPDRAAIRRWKASLRYRSAGAMTRDLAQAMLRDARQTYDQTIQRMRLDGVL